MHPGRSLACCFCTFTWIVNKACDIKHAGDTECLERGKTELLSSLTSCRGVQRPTGLCANVCCVWNMCSRCQVTHQPLPPKGAVTLLAWASTRVGGGSTVAHKRISPVHKDSGPLLTPARSTKEMTFVCFSGRRRCGRTVQDLGRSHG